MSNTSTPKMSTISTTPLSLPSTHLHHSNLNLTPTPTTLSLPTPKRKLIPPLHALPSLADTDTATTLAVVGGGLIAALAAALSLADPEMRRKQQAVQVGGGDKEVVREYFNGTGFQRWKKIYGDTDEVNKVQLDIRVGHAKTVENVIQMLSGDGDLKGVTVCDAGCGTGLLSVPLAKLGAVVYASDISAAMVAEAQSKAREEIQTDTSELVMPKFEVKDLESLDGKYNTVVCLDVLIHYPQDKADAMIAHLASLAENRLILSFAPKTFYYDLLKRIGELFPGPSKATRAYLHAEADVERALQKVGWKIRKRGLVTSQFYFSSYVEAVPLTMKEERCVEEKSRRHPRWTRQETLTLIQAKDITENGPHKGRKIWASENSNSEPKWVMISAYCKQQGVARGPAQCRKRWSNLIGDYKKISTWEANFKDKGNVVESFWAMRNDVRKERKLPVSFDWEVFKVLAGREMSGPEPFSPLPLQAVAASVTQVSYGGNDEDDVEEDEMAEDVEPEPENEDEKTVNDKEGLRFEDVVLLDEGKEKDEILELGLESRDQTTVKHFMESLSDVPEPASDNFKESWPGISYWDSQEKKRRRESTDDLKANNIEAEMMKLLEANNKMVNAQLDIHNKNIQLDREHRKESTDVLVAALGQLTNVLVKIAEKL